MMSVSTHIFNKLANARVSIYFLIREIQNKTCYAFYAQCTNKATKWAVYKSGLWPACQIHSKLGSGDGINHVMAIIDNDGLHVADGDNIDDLLSTDHDERDKAYVSNRSVLVRQRRSKRLPISQEVSRMNVPDAWTAKEWELHKHEVWNTRHTDYTTIARRDFIIAEHARIGSMVKLETEYVANESVIDLWINGLDIRYENTEWFIMGGGKKALHKLDKAFKEAKK